MKNKVLTLLLSLAISFGLWLYVVTVISPESEYTYYNIPVELVGVNSLDDRDLIVVSDTNGLNMNLTLKGNRSDLNKITSANITILADLSKITHPGEHQIKCDISFQSGSAEVLAKDPEYISVTVAQQETKTIDVKPIYTGTVSSGYEAATDDIMLDHQTVTVKGPKDAVEQISYAGINVDLSGKVTMLDSTYPLTLYGINGQPMINTQYVTSNVTEVRAIVQIYRIKKVPLQFLLNYDQSGLQEGMVTLYPQVETVTLIGTEENLAKVDDKLVFTIDLSQYKTTTTETLVADLPDGVHCKEEITVHIQIPEMGTKAITVSNYLRENIPIGLDIQVNGTTEVEIWGPKDVLEGLTSEDVLGIVDCTNINISSSYAPVEFIMPGYEYLQLSTDWGNVFVSVQQHAQDMP